MRRILRFVQCSVYVAFMGQSPNFKKKKYVDILTQHFYSIHSIHSFIRSLVHLFIHEALDLACIKLLSFVPLSYSCATLCHCRESPCSKTWLSAWHINSSLSYHAVLSVSSCIMYKLRCCLLSPHITLNIMVGSMTSEQLCHWF